MSLHVIEDACDMHLYFCYEFIVDTRFQAINVINFLLDSRSIVQFVRRVSSGLILWVVHLDPDVGGVSRIGVIVILDGCSVILDRAFVCCFESIDVMGDPFEIGI